MQQMLTFEPPATKTKKFESLYTPRPYQKDAIEEFFRLSDSGAVGSLIRCNTGGGKTFIGSWAANEWLERGKDHYVMVLAHERQLVNQFRDEVEDLLGVRPGLEMSTDGQVTFDKEDPPRIIVASRASLYEDKNGHSRLYKFDWRKNWLVIYDECHRYKYSLKSVRHIVDWFEQNPESRRLGLTATPERSDGVSLERLFPGIALDYKMYDIDGGPSAVNDGWAVPYDQRFVTVHGVDFTNLKEVGGDFDDDELDEVLSQREALSSLVKPTMDLVGKRRTIIFNPGVKMARMVAETINQEIIKLEKEGVTDLPGQAKSLDGSINSEKRQDVYQSHQNGEIQFLSVCGLCREGYNDPGIQAVAIFRPTKSKSLAEQMKGRGCRPLKGVVDGLKTREERFAAIKESEKSDCMIVDLVGITGMPDVASTAHIMAEGKPDEVIALANKMAMEADSPVNLAEEIKKAEQQINEEKEAARINAELRNQLACEEAKRLSRLETDVSYSHHQVHNGNGGASTRRRNGTVHRMPFGKFKGKMLSELPGWYLMWGVDSLKKGNVKKAFASEIKRRDGVQAQKNGQATPQQVKILNRYGYDCNVSYQRAGEIILKEINPILRRR